MIRHCPDRLRRKGRILAAAFLAFELAACSSNRTQARELAVEETHGVKTTQNQASPILAAGLWADYSGETPSKLPLRVPEGLSTFPSTAKTIFWYARPDMRTRLENMLGSKYRIRWTAPDGSKYEENIFSGSLMQGGVLMSGMKVPYNFDPSLSGRWKVEVTSLEERSELIDARNFWLIRTDLNGEAKSH